MLVSGPCEGWLSGGTGRLGGRRDQVGQSGFAALDCELGHSKGDLGVGRHLATSDCCASSLPYSSNPFEVEVEPPGR